MLIAERPALGAPGSALPATFAASTPGSPQVERSIQPTSNATNPEVRDVIDGGSGGTWTLKGTFEVGRPFAGKWERAIRESAWNLNLKLDLQVLGSSLLTKTFGYRLEGAKEDIDAFQRWFDRAVREWNS